MSYKENVNRIPFLLKPVGKDYLWGGDRLNDIFGKNIEMYPLAETWECSTHREGSSIVANGKYEGKLLSEVLNSHPDFLGSHPKYNGELPILIKLIDARKNLSVQVHPTDEYARKHENEENGKTEMWYILDAKKDAKLVYGFAHSVDKEMIRNSISDGSIEKYLQNISVKKDDVYLIKAGTVHAIGEGTLIAEIQQNSNLTYRLYDYNRMDSNGNKRELHIDKALDVADLEQMSVPRQPIRLLKYKPGLARELLCRCEYFEVYRMLINTEKKQKVTYKADSMSFRVLLCLNGFGMLCYQLADRIEFIEIYKGDCVFVPADSVELTIKGQLQFLDIRG